MLMMKMNLPAGGGGWPMDLKTGYLLNTEYGGESWNTDTSLSNTGVFSFFLQ